MFKVSSKCTQESAASSLVKTCAITLTSSNGWGTQSLLQTAVKSAKGNFPELVKNSYRVLLSLGVKGCYIYFMDNDTERFFKSESKTLAVLPCFYVEI